MQHLVQNKSYMIFKFLKKRKENAELYVDKWLIKLNCIKKKIILSFFYYKIDVSFIYLFIY